MVDGPGEEEGLAAMAEAFETANPGIRFVNAAVSGGAGSNAKAILASRLLANDPPDSYQRHAGLELLDDVRSGKVQDLTELYEQQGWRKVFPKGLLDNLTIDGKIYAVPVNIHRANLIWYNPKTLKELGLAGPRRRGRTSWRRRRPSAPGARCPWPSARSGRRSTSWRPSCSASSVPTPTSGSSPATSAGPRRRSSRHWTCSARCSASPT